MQLESSPPRSAEFDLHRIELICGMWQVHIITRGNLFNFFSFDTIPMPAFDRRYRYQMSSYLIPMYFLSGIRICIPIRILSKSATTPTINAQCMAIFLESTINPCRDGVTSTFNKQIDK